MFSLRKIPPVDGAVFAPSTNDFGSSFRNFFKNFWRKDTKPIPYEPLVNGYNLADKHSPFFQQAGASLFRALDTIIAALGCRIALRGDGNQDNIFARTVERIGGNNQSGTLLERAEIGEWKRNENNVAPFIAGHISNPVRYSKIQMTAPRASGVREYQNQGRSISAVAQATAADLRVLIFLLLAQFGLKSDFAYDANSVPQGMMKAMSAWGNEKHDLSAGVALVEFVLARAIAESNTSQGTVSNKTASTTDSTSSPQASQ